MDERIFERVILTNEKLDGRFMNEKSIETFLAKGAGAFHSASQSKEG